MQPCGSAECGVLVTPQVTSPRVWSHQKDMGSNPCLLTE